MIKRMTRHNSVFAVSLIFIISLSFVILLACSPAPASQTPAQTPSPISPTTATVTPTATPTPNKPAADSGLPANYTTYTDETKTFSIAYPSDWQSALDSLPALSQSVKDWIKSQNSKVPINKASIVYMAGLPTSGGGFLPSCNIVVEPMPSGIFTIDQVADAAVNGAKQILSDYYGYSRQTVNVNGNDTVIISYKATVQKMLFRFMASQTIHSNNVWSITCTSDEQNYSKWEIDFDTILKSFKFLK